MKNILNIFTSVCAYLFVGVIVPMAAVGGVFPGETSMISLDNSQRQEMSHLDNNEDGWQTFSSDGYGFKISYPEEVIKEPSFHGKALNAGIGVDLETPVWKFSIRDQNLYQGTNLLDAALVIHVLRGNQEVLSCSEPKAGSIYQDSGSSEGVLPVVEINGTPFWKDEVTEGLMGEFYRRIIYRTISNEACYEITQLIHTRNIEAFPKDEIKLYSEKEAIKKLNDVLSTFAILNKTPTFPKQEPPTASSEKVVKSMDGSSGDYADGIDVSHWQGDVDWKKVYKAGYTFAFVKSTEGVGVTDWYFSSNMEEGRDAGVRMGAYHFARPDLNETGKVEAEYFLSVVGEYIEAGYLRPVLDIELSGGLNKKALSSWVVEWMTTVKNETGVEPLIYTNYYFIKDKLNSSVAHYDLWIANWYCEPKPTVSMPPTGMFADWDFWQYSAPSGCGYYSIPGIEGGVDLNIFNGGKEALSTFESDAPLWVSLISDTYLAPRPYYADITADVNGSASGPIDYDFWWDCNAPGINVAEIESLCGVLPNPETGQCLENENGLRCIDVVEENQLAENTYHSIGEHVPKVIVHRENATPAEDRYHITVFNPIVSVYPGSSFPEYGVINQLTSFNVDVRMNTSLSGALQVEAISNEDGSILDKQCQKVSDDVRVNKRFELIWSESERGVKNYKIWVRYRENENCPVEDVDLYDQSKDFQIYWGIPNIKIENIRGNDIPRYIEDNVGDQKTSIIHQLIYHVENPEETTRLIVDSISASNTKNISHLSLSSNFPIKLLPDESGTLVINYRVRSTGPFQFDLNVNYNDSQKTPYTFTVSGKGVSPFDDVPDDHWGYFAIEDLYQTGFVSGCSSSPLLYCPDDDVTRAEAAVFLVHGIHGTSFTSPDSEPSFQDISGHWAEDWIKVLADDGITYGCGNENYCPENSTSRAQMAIFILRAMHGSGYEPPDATGHVFDDVHSDYWAADWIEQLAAEGITVGCGNDYYCPNAAVSRAQIAVMIDNAFGIPPLQINVDR